MCRCGESWCSPYRNSYFCIVYDDDSNYNYANNFYDVLFGFCAITTDKVAIGEISSSTKGAHDLSERINEYFCGSLSDASCITRDCGSGFNDSDY